MSYAQTGSDTLTCYTPSELERLANRVVRANECDTLLSICESQLQEKDTAIFALGNVISAKDSVIIAKENIVLNQEAIIAGKDLEITGLETALQKESRKLKWTKVGWAGTSVIFTGIITALLLK